MQETVPLRHHVGTGGIVAHALLPHSRDLSCRQLFGIAANKSVPLNVLQSL